MAQSIDSSIGKGMRSTLFGILISALLAVIKLLAGIFGNSYALIADAIESGLDVLTSLVVLAGLKQSRKPADENHPYGHGKIEPLATTFVALAILAAAILIAIESIHEIRTPHLLPKPFTLYVLLAVILVKEALFRWVIKVAHEIESSVVKADAWHHRGDAVTSAAAFVGISIALIGGEGYESADDFAALFASGILAINSFLLLKPALYELIDAAPDKSLVEKVRHLAHQVEGVMGTHKCNIRKLGFDYYIDLDILCDPTLSIREGHEIAHNVGAALHKEFPALAKILVHVEPVDDCGRRSKDILGKDAPHYVS
jgi:cation diffusion facilitator family transporter